MTPRKIQNDKPVWLGREGGDGAPAMLGGGIREQQVERHEAFGGGKLWIGQHTADQDILVFDPAEADPLANILVLYSLTQHRRRSFARATVVQRIPVLTDEIAHVRAKKDYQQRTTLRAAHEQAQTAERAERVDRQRTRVIASHRRYVEALGLAYQGVRQTPADHNPKRRTKCNGCGINLDNFTDAICEICSGVLCSCGACACKQATRPVE